MEDELKGFSFFFIDRRRVPVIFVADHLVCTSGLTHWSLMPKCMTTQNRIRSAHRPALVRSHMLLLGATDLHRSMGGGWNRAGRGWLGDIDSMTLSGLLPVLSSCSLTALASYKSGPVTIEVNSHLCSSSGRRQKATSLLLFQLLLCCHPLCVLTCVYFI